MNNNFRQRIRAILIRYPIILQFMKFAAIGFLTAGLDFLLLNFLSKGFGVSAGFKLGLLNVISFIAAVIHNYVWQRHWTFAQTGDVGIFRNFLRSVFVGGAGVAMVGMVILSARLDASVLVYGALIVVFALLLWGFWSGFDLFSTDANGKIPVQFTAFLVVSIIGLTINTLVVSLASQYLVDYGLASDLAKNVAKVGANAVSLVWNFLGYKLIVFKK